MHWTENPAMQVRVLPVAQINSVVEEWFISSALGAEARRFESDLRYKKIVKCEIANHSRLSDILYYGFVAQLV